MRITSINTPPSFKRCVGMRSTSDYSGFGVQLDERTSENEGYRYGFQGQERDDEVKGDGNSVNYTFRMHDPRVGRFFAVDPLKSQYPHYSSYSFSGNRVIDKVELEGLEPGTTVHHAVKGALTLPNAFGNIGVKTVQAGVVRGFYLPNSDGTETYYQAAWVGERFVGYYKTLTEDGLSTGLGPDGSNTMETAPYHSWQDSDNSFVQGAAELVGDKVVYGPQQEGFIVESNSGALAKEVIVAYGVVIIGVVYLGSYINLADYCSFDIHFQWPTMDPVDVIPERGIEILESNPTKVKDKEAGSIVSTPSTEKELFKPGEGKEKVNKETGEIWEKSTSSHREKKGDGWKVWPDRKSKSQNKNRRTVDGDGRVMKGN
jgi:RHS repeat-associated protein